MKAIPIEAFSSILQSIPRLYTFWLFFFFWLLLQGHLLKWSRQVSEVSNPRQWPNTVQVSAFTLRHQAHLWQSCHKSRPRFLLMWNNDDKNSTYLHGLLGEWHETIRGKSLARCLALGKFPVDVTSLITIHWSIASVRLLFQTTAVSESPRFLLSCLFFKILTSFK